MHLTEYMTSQKRTRARGILPELTVREMITDRKGNRKLQDRLISDEPHNIFLGLTLQNNLSWDAHLTVGRISVLPAVRKQLGMINKISSSLSQKARNQLVSSLAISKLAYSICQWGNTSANQITRAQTVLNTATRIVTRLPRTTRVLDLMRELDWLRILLFNTNVEICQMEPTREHGGQVDNLYTGKNLHYCT